MAQTYEKEIDKLIDIYLSQPKVLYEHLFAGFHQFVSEIIPYSLIQENNYFYQNVIENKIYFHGFKISNIRIKPPTSDNDNELKYILAKYLSVLIRFSINTTFIANIFNNSL
jgi:DNA-directed RNA polymerase II subunit RPB2